MRDVSRCEDTECARESRELRDSAEEPRDEALEDSLTERHEPLELVLSERSCECVLGEGGSSTRSARLRSRVRECGEPPSGSTLVSEVTPREQEGSTRGVCVEARAPGEHWGSTQGADVCDVCSLERAPGEQTGSTRGVDVRALSVRCEAPAMADTPAIEGSNISLSVISLCITGATGPGAWPGGGAGGSMWPPRVSGGGIRALSRGAAPSAAGAVDWAAWPRAPPSYSRCEGARAPPESLLSMVLHKTPMAFARESSNSPRMDLISLVHAGVCGGGGGGGLGGVSLGSGGPGKRRCGAPNPPYALLTSPCGPYCGPYGA